MKKLLLVIITIILLGGGYFLYTIYPFAKGVAEDNRRRDVYMKMQAIINEYISVNDSLSLERKVIILDVNSMVEDTTFYILKTIVGQENLITYPTNYQKIRGSYILDVNNVVASAAGNKSVIIDSIINNYLITGFTKTYNPIVWQIKEINGELIVDRNYSEILIATPVTKFDPPKTK